MWQSLWWLSPPLSAIASDSLHSKSCCRHTFKAQFKAVYLNMSKSLVLDQGIICFRFLRTENRGLGHM